MKTAFNATRLAIAAFVVPYIFAFSPTMLFEFPSNLTTIGVIISVVQICVTSLMGIYGIAAALNGYLFRPMNILFRAAMIAGGLCMMIPGTLTDLIGLVLVAGSYVLLRASAKKAEA